MSVQTTSLANHASDSCPVSKHVNADMQLFFVNFRLLYGLPLLQSNSSPCLLA